MEYFLLQVDTGHPDAWQQGYFVPQAIPPESLKAPLPQIDLTPDGFVQISAAGEIPRITCQDTVCGRKVSSETELGTGDTVKFVASPSSKIMVYRAGPLPPIRILAKI
ncbi:hypothetical protein GF362_01975 [Candidatus Dojkabacteria bacterium]|nr:hypothetical protein [Candidatus Dojkabacteria bacterium]